MNRTPSTPYVLAKGVPTEELISCDILSRKVRVAETYRESEGCNAECMLLEGVDAVGSTNAHLVALSILGSKRTVKGSKKMSVRVFVGGNRILVIPLQTSISYTQEDIDVGA